MRTDCPPKCVHGLDRGIRAIVVELYYFVDRILRAFFLAFTHRFGSASTGRTPVGETGQALVIGPSRIANCGHEATRFNLEDAGGPSSCGLSSAG